MNKTSVRRWNRQGGWVFLGPPAVLLALFVLLPLTDLLMLSFQKWNGLGARTFVGTNNFEDLLTDPRFWAALRNNLLFSIGTVVGTITLGFGLALAVDRRVPGWRAYKVIYFLPVMISMAVVAVLFSAILEPNFGLLNTGIRAVGLEGLAKVWLGDPALAMPVIMLVWTWQYTGLAMIYLLAAMESIPQSLHDAATVDGVSELQRVRYIVLPLTRGVLTTVVLLQLVFSLKVFDIAWVMTKGGPGFATEVWAILMYRAGFIDSRFGYAAAVAVTMSLVIGLGAIAYQRAFRTKTYEY
jgi:ABC-type sugar transport system permease subunit